MRTFLMGFVYAGRGVKKAVQEERNMRFHLCAAFYVLLFSLFYRLTRLEYAAVFIVIFSVFSAEMINTSIECVVDQLTPEKNSSACFAKDVAAGAVLMASIGAAICGFLLFWDTETFARIVAYFSTHLFLLALLVLSIAFSCWFIFGWGRVPKDKAQKGEK